jgi:hypothetical protein
LLSLSRARGGLSGARPQTPLHPALPASNEWQGRAIHSDSPEPLGLRSCLRNFSREDRSATQLADPLQLQSTTWLPRPQATRRSPRRARTTSWVTTTAPSFSAEPAVFSTHRFDVFCGCLEFRSSSKARRTRTRYDTPFRFVRRVAGAGLRRPPPQRLAPNFRRPAKGFRYRLVLLFLPLL